MRRWRRARPRRPSSPSPRPPLQPGPWPKRRYSSRERKRSRFRSLYLRTARQGVGTVRHEAPGGGEREHLGEDRQRAVGGAGCLAQAIVQRRDVGALDHAKRHHAERRQDVVLQRAPVDAGGMRIAVLCDVGRSCSARRGRRRWCRSGAGVLPGSSPRLMRSMTWAARLRACVAVISPWVPSVTRRGPPPARLWTT